MSDSPHVLFETALKQVPAPLRAPVENAWETLAVLSGTTPDRAWLKALPRVLAASDFVARACVREPELLRELLVSGNLARAYVPGELAMRVSRALEIVTDESALKVRLRHIRQREMVRIAFRDLAGWADLNEVMAALSELADACLEGALTSLTAWLKAPPGFVALGMGKLGGRELNFSSDVDLIFAYAGDDDSRHEQFLRLGQKLVQALNDPTADGIVFRVDLRLRPHGASGPLAVSFDAMENYYQVHGREWERYALIKARVAAGDRVAGEGCSRASSHSCFASISITARLSRCAR